MTRPSVPDDIQQGSSGWDAVISLIKDLTLGGPIPIFEHDGDESDLEAAWPAADYRNCLIWVEHSVDGWGLYVSDEVDWVLFSSGSGGGGSGSWLLPPTINPTSAYTVLDDDQLILKTNNTALAVNLPAASAHEGRVLVVKNATGTSNDVTIVPDGSDTVDGASSLVLEPSGGAQLVSDGISAWHVI